jgi:hypothetical protein
MIEEKTLVAATAPSKTKIVKASVVALLVATVVLFTAILPAEYGIDPLGVGSMLGLTDLAAADVASEAPAPAASATPAAPAAPPAAGVQHGAYREYPRTYKMDSRDVVLKPGKGTEIKNHMAKDAVMVYSWTASDKVLFEFHGEPDKKPTKEYYDSYEKDDKVGKTESFGSFTAPSTGIHGWFWENKTKSDVKIRLNTAGFYDWAREYNAEGVKDLPVQVAR